MKASETKANWVSEKQKQSKETGRGGETRCESGGGGFFLSFVLLLSIDHRRWLGAVASSWCLPARVSGVCDNAAAGGDYGRVAGALVPNAAGPCPRWLHLRLPGRSRTTDHNITTPTCTHETCTPRAGNTAAAVPLAVLVLASVASVSSSSASSRVVPSRFVHIHALSVAVSGRGDAHTPYTALLPLLFFLHFRRLTRSLRFSGQPFTPQTHKSRKPCSLCTHTFTRPRRRRP